MYGKQLDAPLEEVTEMIAILKAIQKQQREIHLLSERARVMCPNLMDMSVQDDLYRYVYYAVSHSVTYDQTPERLIEDLQKRLHELRIQEKEEKNV